MKLFRISSLLSLSIAAVLGALLFWTSQLVQESESGLSQVKSSVDSEKEMIRVLSTEWDYLNRPQRLETLARRYLKMEPAQAGDMMDEASAIPEPAAPVIPSIKPAVLNQPVSLKPVSQSVPQEIRKPDSQQFESLLKELNAEGGAR